MLTKSVMIRFCNIDFSLVEQALLQKNASVASQARNAIEFEVVDMRMADHEFEIQKIYSVSIWRGSCPLSDGIMAVAGNGCYDYLDFFLK